MNILIDGLATGMLLFLLSVGLSVTLGLMNFVNLAHGAFAMFGGYVCVSLLDRLGLPWAASLVLAVTASALLGGLLERVLYRRLYGASHLDQVLMTIGLAFVAVASATYLYGDQQQTLALPAALNARWGFAGARFSAYRGLLIVLGLGVAGGLHALVAHTRFGARLRAAVDNPRAARGLGIDVDRVFTLSFMLGSALAGLGGALGIPMLGLSPEYPLQYIVYVLIVVAMGGSGSIAGSLLGSLLLGLADAAGQYYLPQLSAFVIYAVMVATLVLRPQGLFGRLSSR